MVFKNILEAIGKTPLVQLNSIVDGLEGQFYAKIESFNPGQSAKDRIALYMIEKAEREGQLQPGATLVEATSGNTGFSLAMVSRVKGYNCVLTVSSKTSMEKINALRAMGARVVVCPKGVEADDPRSYYSRAKSLCEEIPNAYYVNQNFNLDNSDAHYHTTGPEIWEQTEGKITHYICCAGTGGTISGTARFLKEKNPNIEIIAVDAYGSVLKKYYQTGKLDPNEIKSYRVEGLGKTIIPANVNFDIIDHFEKVTDEDSAHAARALANKEGIFCGYSSGSVMQTILQLGHHFTKDDVVVGLFSDHGSKYLGKIYNNDWMEQQGFIEANNPTEPVKVFE